MFWALMIVVSLKYVVLIMRADNRGEGGTMALIALAAKAIRSARAGAAAAGDRHASAPRCSTARRC